MKAEKVTSRKSLSIAKEVHTLWENLEEVKKVTHSLLQPFNVPDVLCRLSFLAVDIVRQAQTPLEKKEEADSWAVSCVVFLYVVIPALISPVKEGVLKGPLKPQLSTIFLTVGKFILKICNNIRYPTEPEEYAEEMPSSPPGGHLKCCPFSSSSYPPSFSASSSSCVGCQCQGGGGSSPGSSSQLPSPRRLSFFGKRESNMTLSGAFSSSSPPQSPTLSLPSSTGMGGGGGRVLTSEMAAGLNEVMDVLRPLYQGFCSGVVKRGETLSVPNPFLSNSLDHSSSLLEYLKDNRAKILSASPSSHLSSSHLDSLIEALLQRQSLSHADLDIPPPSPSSSSSSSSSRRLFSPGRKRTLSHENAPLVRGNPPREKQEGGGEGAGVGAGGGGAMDSPFFLPPLPGASHLSLEEEDGEGGWEGQSVTESSKWSPSLILKRKKKKSKTPPSSPNSKQQTQSLKARSPPRQWKNEEGELKRKKSVSLNEKKKRSLFAKLSSHDMIRGGGASSSSSSSSTPLPPFSETDHVVSFNSHLTSSPHPSSPHLPQSSPRFPSTSPSISFEATRDDKVLLSYFKTFLGENDNSKPLTLLEFTSAVGLLEGLSSSELMKRGGAIEMICSQFLQPRCEMMSAACLPPQVTEIANEIQEIYTNATSDDLYLSEGGGGESVIMKLDEAADLLRQVLAEVLFPSFLTSRYYSRYRVRKFSLE